MIIFSAVFWQKFWVYEYNKIKIKSSSSLLLGVYITLEVPPLMDKINAHNVSGVRNWVIILPKGLLQKTTVIAMS